MELQDGIDLNAPREDNRANFYQKLCAMKYKCILYVGALLLSFGYIVTSVLTEIMKNNIIQSLSINNSDTLRSLAEIAKKALEKNDD